MAQNNVKLSIPRSDVTLITPGALNPRPAYEYDGNKRTDRQRTHTDGWEIFTMQDVSAKISDASVIARIETGSDNEIPAGSILQPANDVELAVRATSSKGSDFATLAVTLTYEDWDVVGNVMDAINTVSTTDKSKTSSDFFDN